MKKKQIRTVLLLMLMIVLGFIVYLPSEAAGRSVARIGKKNYSSFSQAVSSVKKNQTIVLLKNVTEKQQIRCEKNIKYKINLNKHTLKLKTAIMVNKGNITIYNGTMKSSDTYFRSLLEVRKKAKVTINGGTYVGVLKTQKGGTLKINKGTFKNYSGFDNIINMGTTVIKKGTFRATGKESGNIGNAGKITIYNGSFTSDGRIINTNDTASRVTIKKGTFYSKGKYDVISKEMFECYEGKMSISNANIKADGYAYPAYIYSNGSIAVKKCTFVFGSNLKNNESNQYMFNVLGKLNMDGCTVVAKGKTAINVNGHMASFVMKNSRITGEHAYRSYEGNGEQYPLFMLSEGIAQLQSGTIRCTDPNRDIFYTGANMTLTRGAALSTAQ